MTEPAQPLDAKALYFINVVEEEIQLFVASDTEIIANAYRAKDLT